MSTTSAKKTATRYFKAAVIPRLEATETCIFCVVISSPPAGLYKIAPHHCALVDYGKPEADNEDNHRDRAAVAELEAQEPELVQVGRHRIAGVDRTAGGHDPDQVEELERSKDREVDREPDGAAEQRDGDVAQRLQAIAAVDLGRLFQLGRNVLQPGGVQDH